MRVLSKLVLAAIALGAFTTTASAAVNITSADFNAPIGPTETLVWNFNTHFNIVADSHFSFTPSANVHIGNVMDQWAAPFGDHSHYGIAAVGSPSTFQIQSGFELTTLSLYIGSLDDYNSIEFVGNGVDYTFNGTQLASLGGGSANHSPTDAASNRRYYFTFDASDDITKVIFSTTKPAFEFDNIAATFISTVPEPATWAMMILGFGFVGFMMRSNRQKAGALIA